MHDPVKPVEFLFEHRLIKEEKGGKGLILGRGRNILANGQVGQKLVDLGLTHLRRVTLLVKENEAPDPANVGFLQYGCCSDARESRRAHDPAVLRAASVVQTRCASFEQAESWEARV